MSGELRPTEEAPDEYLLLAIRKENCQSSVDLFNGILAGKILIERHDKRIAVLECQLKHRGNPCHNCWTSSWAPCEENEEDAVKFEDGWMICQQCQVTKWNRQHRERITELEAKIKTRDKLLLNANRAEHNTMELVIRAEKAETENDRLCEQIDPAFKGMLGGSRAECIAFGRNERQAEIDRLHGACQALSYAIDYDIDHGRQISTRVGAAHDNAKKALGHD